ncbi:uncharacterized protein LOC128736325 [Sabethes cyaneus]|uniref:uncharacterized protein LOC128736325 n=1 Tax=Sabethes cyaneus TaxID=53552 RepID=UPI00237D9101|nr:uncharacterized protein LOC128736325 [Sabethes cyaneus]
MNNGGGFVKAYSNNWLSQFGLYKYEAPEESPRKQSFNHRKVSLYGILALAFVAFLVLFIIVNKVESSRRELIMESFSNETSIESSMGHTVLTTPFSSSNLQSSTGLQAKETAEARKQRRFRRLGPENPTIKSTDNLVLFPSAYLKPPRLGSMRRFSEDFSLSGNPQPALSLLLHPVGAPLTSTVPNPSGFSKQNNTYELEDPENLRSPRKHRHQSLVVNNIQDVLNQLQTSKHQNHKYFPLYQQHPSEFSNPIYQNHRVKFSGIYRHPRKNGDITTLFGDSSKQHELHIAKPQIINSQLDVPSVYMPDLFYNFRPTNPSDVNLLATNQFRFAPVKNDGTYERTPKGMPFSIMLDIEPMTDGSPNLRRPTVKKRPIPNYSSMTFPPFFSNHNFAQVKHAMFNQPPSLEDDYYRRSTTSRYRPSTTVKAHPSTATTLGGKLMVHLNLYPKKPSPLVESRKLELQQSDYDINRLSLSEEKFLPDPERDKVKSTVEPVRNYLEVLPDNDTTTSTATTTTSTTTTVIPPVVKTSTAAQSTRNVVETVKSVEIPSRVPLVNSFQQRMSTTNLMGNLHQLDGFNHGSTATKLSVPSFHANDAN